MYAVPMTFVPGGLNSTRESFDVQVTTTTITTTEQENISSEDEESNQSRLGIGAGSKCGFAFYILHKIWCSFQHTKNE